jgi:hypothetical protein
MIQLLISLIVLGAVLYVVQRLPIDETIKMLIKVVAIVAILIYALKFLLVFIPPV